MRSTLEPEAGFSVEWHYRGRNLSPLPHAGDVNIACSRSCHVVITSFSLLREADEHPLMQGGEGKLIIGTTNATRIIVSRRLGGRPTNSDPS